MVTGEKGQNCPVCKQPMDSGPIVRCASCDIPHHHPCWSYGGGCSVFGCGCVEFIDEQGLRRRQIEATPLKGKARSDGHPVPAPAAMPVTGVVAIVGATVVGLVVLGGLTMRVFTPRSRPHERPSTQVAALPSPVARGRLEPAVPEPSSPLPGSIASPAVSAVASPRPAGPRTTPDPVVAPPPSAAANPEESTAASGSSSPGTAATPTASRLSNDAEIEALLFEGLVGSEVTPELVRALADEDPDLSAAAAFSLERLHMRLDRETFKASEAAIERAARVQALRARTSSAKQTGRRNPWEGLAAAVSVDDGKVGDRMAVIAKEQKQKGNSGTGFAMSLIGGLLNRNGLSTMSLWMSMRLAGHDSPRVYQAITRLTSSTDPGLRKAALEAAEDFGGASGVSPDMARAIQSDASSYVRLLGDPDPAVRRKAAESIQSPTPEAEAALEKMTTDADDDARMAAFQALLAHHMGSPRHAELAKRCLKDPYKWLRMMGLRSLAGTAPKDAQVMKLLIDCVNSDDQELAEEACGELEKLERIPPDAVPGLIRALDTPYAAGASRNARSLGRIGRAAAAAVERLERMAVEAGRSDEVHRAAQDALARIRH